MSDWYYLVDSEQKGPASEAALKDYFAAEVLPPETYVWKEGMEGWEHARQVPVFFTLSGLPAAPLEPPGMEKKVERPVCAQCQSPQTVPGHATPLCQPCRQALIGRPLPLWLKIAAGALVLLMLVSAVRIPWELSASLQYEWGQIAEQKGDYKEAVRDYQKALLSYPRSVDILSSLARAAHRAGDQDTALDCVNRIIARAGPSGEISNDTLNVINEVRGTHP